MNIEKDQQPSATAKIKTKKTILKRIIKFVIDIQPYKPNSKQKYDETAITKTLSDLSINIDFADKEMANIPETGPFIVISNHPFGGIDGMILLQILLKKRPDIKILATDLIKKVPILDQYSLQFDSSRKVNSIKSGIGQVLHALQYLGKEHPLCIFPSGDVSTYNVDSKIITDKKWCESYLSFIQKAEVPVVPAYINGTNGNLFHLLGSVHPALKTAGDLIAKRNKNIEVRFGQIIFPEELAEFKSIEKIGRYLRAKTYTLDSKLDISKFFTNRFQARKKISAITDSVPNDLILKDIETLRKNHTLFKSGDMTVFCAPSNTMPNALREIGRLREITFRAIGEGTNTSIDVDEFDLYYNHLFIWDEKESKIVGAYRAGLGKDIIQLYGTNGFYLNSLFKMDSKIQPILEQSIELGRSFIVEEYQRKPLPLFLLWKGIIYFLLQHSEYRYLIGPVSISNQFSKFSKDLIIRFLTEYYYDKKMAKYIKPRKPFKPSAQFDTDIILEKAKDDIKKIDKVIGDTEPNNYKIPILLKKYLQQNAKIIGFNIDSKFNNALDGLIILDLFEVPYNTIESLSKELENESILERFNKIF